VVECRQKGTLVPVIAINIGDENMNDSFDPMAMASALTEVRPIILRRSF